MRYRHTCEGDDFRTSERGGQAMRELHYSVALPISHAAQNFESCYNVIEAPLFPDPYVYPLRVAAFEEDGVLGMFVRVCFGVGELWCVCRGL